MFEGRGSKRGMRAVMVLQFDYNGGSPVHSCHVLVLRDTAQQVVAEVICAVRYQLLLRVSPVFAPINSYNEARGHFSQIYVHGFYRHYFLVPAGVSMDCKRSLTS